mmetsp:Transcript_10721/g.40282  ORF Transcript_10721/g.40282 Transcript_10721/m.40282 type:complete len:284 (-) Transcript_10721:3108-3959(-)
MAEQTMPEVLSPRAAPAAFHAVRWQGASLREDAHRERPAPLENARAAIATAPAAQASRSRSEAERPQNDGEVRLENLGVCDARVGHVRMHPRRSMPPRTCTCPTGDGLIVAKRVVPERKVAHAPLRGRAGLEGAKDDVRHSLRRQDVASDDSSTGRWIQQRAGPGDDLHGVQAALIQRQIRRRQQAPEAVDHRRSGDCGWRIRVADDFRVGGREVKDGRSLRWPSVPADGHFQRDSRAVVHVVLGRHPVSLSHSAIQAEVVKHPANASLGVVLDVQHVVLHCI